MHIINRGENLMWTNGSLYFSLKGENQEDREMQFDISMDYLRQIEGWMELFASNKAK